MARTIKRISHDLTPISISAGELSALLIDMLSGIKNSIHFASKEAEQNFINSLEVAENLVISIDLIKKYVEDVDLEAAREEIEK